MDFTIEGKIRFRSERGSYRIDIVDKRGNDFGVVVNVPQLGPVLRTLEHSARDFALPSIDPQGQILIEEIASKTDPAGDEGKAFVRRCYDLTTRFHQKTGQKVVINDLLEAFFVDSMKDVEDGDRSVFERCLVSRLEKQAPGWDNA